MTRRLLKTVLALLAALMMVGSAEAAGPKKPVRHRTKHSTRVASGQSAVKKKTVVKKRQPSSSSAKSHTTTKKPAPPKRKPSTKPR